MKTIAIAQARMGSTRAPGKVMRPLEGIPVLRWTLAALYAAEGIDKVILATSTLPADDVIADYCAKHGDDCFRGSESDVLDRFYQCAVAEQADVIIRVTCDCPFLDPAVISQVIKLREMTNADYCSNIEPPTFPDGLDVECFTFKALAAAWNNATRPTDRDCVTQYIIRNRYSFPASNLTCPLPWLRKERWVLDTEDDCRFCQELAKRVGPTTSYVEILNALDKEPHLREINNAKLGAGRNERFFAGIATEKLPRRRYDKSRALHERALEHIPYGAQTFSKSHLQFPAGKAPLFVSHADGARIFDVDGNDYIDLVSALLPVILGYRDPDVDYAIRCQLDSGISFSLATELESKLSELLCRIIPCAEMVKLGKTGTDVTTAAVRLARAYTGRKLIMYSGYHGWADWSMSMTERNLGIIDGQQSLPFRRGHIEDIRDHISGSELRDLAAVIVEADNLPNYLHELRQFCTENGTILIFDEIITGFRYDLGGAQKLFGVTPDLACFGKAMGNGMPISALVGKREIMKRMEPPNNIFYSGTFFGETLSIAAAIATIEKLERENVSKHLNDFGYTLGSFIVDKLPDVGIELSGLSCRTTLKFKSPEIQSLFISEMAQNGVLIINSNNITYAMGEPEYQRITSAYEATFATIAQQIKDGTIGDIEPIAAKPLRAVT